MSRCAVDVVVPPGPFVERARFVIEELLACLDLVRCPSLRITYGTAYEEHPVPRTGSPWIHIQASPLAQDPRASLLRAIPYAGSVIPVIGSFGPDVIDGFNPVVIRFDLIATAFFFLSGCDISHRPPDPLGRRRYSGSVLASLRPSVPPVNALVGVLEAAIRHAGGNVAILRDPMLCVSHDHDVTSRGVRGRIRGALSALGSPSDVLRYIAFGEDTLHALIEWEREHEIQPTTFAWAGHARGALDWVGDTRALLNSLRRSGFAEEIALHASHYTEAEEWSLERQVEALTSRIGIRPSGVRLHNLRYDIAHMSPQVEAARLAYDSSVAYPDAPEFATGFTYPHRLFSVEHDRPFEFMEVPLYLMDETFRKYLRARPLQMRDAILEAGEVVATWGGCLTILWHHHIGDDRFARGYREAFQSAVVQLMMKGLPSVPLVRAAESRRAAYARIDVTVT